jgi:tetratricopeptide (TPR) repeat protein
MVATLSALGGLDEAIDYYGDMLRLNPNDNQVIRYILASLPDCSRCIATMVAQFALYGRALTAFRESEGSDAKAKEFARNALRADGMFPRL